VSVDAHDAFRHEALLYEGLDGFVPAVASFLREGARRDEPALVVVDAQKIALLREALGPDASGVHFADMATVGANPARIIPAWRDFVAEQEGSARRFRGVGEPVWAARSADELSECQRHESLLNVAFEDGPAWWLLCPYDTTSLPDAVLDEAAASHPYVSGDLSARYRGGDGSEVFDGGLPEPEPPVARLAFDDGPLRLVREFVRTEAAVLGLGPGRLPDVLVAATELASNSVRHGGGSGTLRLWAHDGALVIEVRDAGRMRDPLVGRARPTLDRRDGRGVWLVHQLCDLVQIRSNGAGTTVRAHVSLHDHTD
jgi:anti-sigma regulatory factor (Ser/Thr protein kinase)